MGKPFDRSPPRRGDDGFPPPDRRFGREESRYGRDAHPPPAPYGRDDFGRGGPPGGPPRDSYGGRYGRDERYVLDLPVYHVRVRKVHFATSVALRGLGVLGQLHLDHGFFYWAFRNPWIPQSALWGSPSTYVPLIVPTQSVKCVPIMAVCNSDGRVFSPKYVSQWSGFVSKGNKTRPIKKKSMYRCFFLFLTI